MKLKIRKSQMHKTFLAIFFVLVYFTPEFRFLPYYTWVLALLGAVVLFDTKERKRLGLFSRTNINFTGYFIIGTVCLGIIVPIIHRTFDFSYLPTLIGMLLCLLRNYLVGYVILKNKFLKQNPIINYIDIFISACCICVLFTILFIIFPGFKEIWLENIIVNNVSEHHANWAAYEFRYSVGGFAAYSYATLFSIGVVLQAYMILKKGMNLREIIRFGVMCVGCFFYGRITFFAIAIAVVYIVAKEKNLINTFKFIIYILLAVIGIMIALQYLGTLDSRFLVWSKWAFSFIEDIFLKGEITTHSVNNILDNMYFIPELKTILLGDGYYTDPISGKYYMSTDVGYMRMLLYGGIVGVLIAYAAMLYMIYCIYIKSKNRDIKRLVAFLFFTWMILEAKGESYFRVILLLYPIFLFCNAEDKYELSN